MTGALAVLLGALALTSSAPPAPAVAVAGTETTVFELVHPRALPRIPDHQAVGYTQRVLRHDGRRALVEVAVDISPIGSRALYPIEYLPEASAPYLKPGSPDGLIAELASETARGAGSVYEASLKLLDLTASHIEDRHDHHSEIAQDPSSVWQEGRATCVGRANLAVALLRSAHIPARTAHGIRFPAPPGTTATISPELLHRWVESFLPDRGWVPSDTAHSLHWVGSSYLLLDVGEELPRRVDQELVGLQIRVLDRKGGVRRSDLADPSLALTGLGPPTAPNRASRVAGALRVAAPPETLLRLEGPGTRRTVRTDAYGSAVFVGLKGGLYRVRAKSGGRAVVLVSRDGIAEATLR